MSLTNLGARPGAGGARSVGDRGRVAVTRASGIVAAAIAGMSGCYGAAPPRPADISLPEPVPGAEIVVDSETSTSIERVPKKWVRCPHGHVEGSPECDVTTGSAMEPVTRTRTTASYGGAPLNLAQFMVLTDPERDDKLRLLEDHSRACRRANVPRWIGVGLTVGGLVVMGVAASQDGEALSTAGQISVAGGVGSYAVGYFALGGRRCNEAANLHTALDLADETVITVVPGPAAADEMKELADRFNRARAARGDAPR
jgi:hypothetical protein